MDADNNSAGNSKMVHIDLNEAPVPSPREAVDVATVGVVCTMCRQGIPVGRVPGRATEEPRQENKCFRCLLKADGGSIGRGGYGGRFDINASPPCESEDRDSVEIVAIRDGGSGSCNVQASFSSLSSHSIATRQLNPALEGIAYYVPKRLLATDSANFGYRGMLQQNLHSKDLHPVRKESFESRAQASNSTQLRFLPEKSPNMLYLQSLREYIAERSGVLGEGWHVEFQFCDKMYKTSAVYIAPDGSRLKSMEDVAHHIGLPSRHHMDIGKGSSEFALIESGLKLDPSKKESFTFMTAPNSRHRQRMLRANRSQSFLSSSGIITCPDIPCNKGAEEVRFSDSRKLVDGTHDGFPIQFQDFFLISAGKVDPRASYHSTNLIWPVGYRSCWHDRITGSLFICDVVDGDDFGPIFKVQRYLCTKQSVPVGSTILSKTKPISCKEDDGVRKGDLAAFQVGDDDSISTITLLNEDSPPSLENCLSTSKREDSFRNSQEDYSSNSDLECLPNRTGNLSATAVGLDDVIGEFQIEGRSTSNVWEMVTKTLLYGFQELYKQKGAVKFFCGHDTHGINDENLEIVDSFSRYCSVYARVNFPPLVQNENEFKVACGMLLAWLNQDRFGLDADFVQEIIEQLPGAGACSKYRSLNSRKNNSVLQTVGSGLLQAEKNTNSASGTSRRPHLKLGVSEDLLNQGPCPLGKPLSSKLPSYLIGDALQVWEFAWRFSDVLGLGQVLSFQELESELVSPWMDSYPWKSSHDAGAVFSTGQKVSQAGEANPGRCIGFFSAKIISSLLKVLVWELTSKAAAHVCPNFDTGESKSRRGKKKDLDSSSALKKTKLDMLPVNGLTWHEIAHRYILAVLSMEGNVDSTEIANRESGKVFHCLYGDGGILCGSLTGVAALEGDAMVLADAMKEVYGSLKGKNEIVSLCERESDSNATQTIEFNDGAIPEWAQVLEPVRKLPTNVGARIRRCINEALEKNPPEWAKEILKHSISKEVYKGNASGPTKRAVISVLARVSIDDLQPKADKNDKSKVKTSVADLISKQCRIVLRQAVALDVDKVFSNLLARMMLNPNDNEDGLLGYPAMVSRPLDFRTIDLRLAAGVDGGSHEAFVDDVREVWHNIHSAFGDRPDLVALAEDLSNKFEELYEKEVLTLVRKISEVSNGNDSNAEALKESADLLLCVCNSSLPRAPWDEGICKVCGMDKDDENVLLCGKCDSEYHRYCLNPPFIRIPEGKWYCPSCVGGQSVVSSADYESVATQSRNKTYQRPFTSKFLEGLAQLANLMEVKECWEFTVEERIFFIKFLFDEALNSTTIRDHMEQCAAQVADLQQKLRALTSELRLLKTKEEALGLSTGRANSGVQAGHGDLKSDASSSLVAIESSLRGKRSEKGSRLPPHLGVTQIEHGHPPRSTKSSGSTNTLNQPECQQLPDDHDHLRNIISHGRQSRVSDLQTELPIIVQHLKSDKSQADPVLSASQVMPGLELSGPTINCVTEHMQPEPMGTMHESHGELVHTTPHQANVLSSEDNSSKVGTVKNDIIKMQNTIASLELELHKVSLRKDFLGRDSSGRVYWAFCSAGARPWIISSGDSAAKNQSSEEFISVPGSDKWTYYECDDEIGKLVGWMRDDHVREKELRESILQLQVNKLKDSQYTGSHSLSKGVMDHSKEVPLTDFLNMKALTALEKKFGPSLGAEVGGGHLPSGRSRDRGTYRCECLEPLWLDKEHCFSCHLSFSCNEDLIQHSKDNCKPLASAPRRSLTTEDTSKLKKPRIPVSHGKHPYNLSTSEKQNDGSNYAWHNRANCPFNFKEIMTRFSIAGSVKDSVNEIGLIGSAGIPSFLPMRPSYLGDPALALGSSRNHDWANSSGVPTDSRSQRQHPKGTTRKEIKESNRVSRYAAIGLAEGYSFEQLKSGLMSESNLVSSGKGGGTFLGLSKSNIIRESSSRPLVGKAAEILRFLKINLLDMDAALPDDALRTSRSNHDKRCAWREFVKSAKSIYEMVQATIVFEDTIRSEYLRNSWWYWSSPATAAKISTLSALALRIYTLDSVISYEKLLCTTDAPEPNCGSEEAAASGKNSTDPSSQSMQSTPELDSSDTLRTTQSRACKRRKD